MSFSFTVTAASKAEALVKIEEQFASVVQSQPTHAADQQTVTAAAAASVNTLVDPSETEVVYVSVSGSLGWRGEGEFTSASLSVTASIRPAE